MGKRSRLQVGSGGVRAHLGLQPVQPGAWRLGVSRYQNKALAVRVEKQFSREQQCDSGQEP